MKCYFGIALIALVLLRAARSTPAQKDRRQPVGSAVEAPKPRNLKIVGGAVAVQKDDRKRALAGRPRPRNLDVNRVVKSIDQCVPVKRVEKLVPVRRGYLTTVRRGYQIVPKISGDVLVPVEGSYQLVPKGGKLVPVKEKEVYQCVPVPRGYQLVRVTDGYDVVPVTGLHQFRPVNPGYHIVHKISGDEDSP